MYQNTSTQMAGNNASSMFIDPVLTKTAQFVAKSSAVNFKSGKTDMVNVTVRVNQPQPVGTPGCDPCGTDKVTTSAEVRFNIIKGDLDSLTALRVDVLALLDKAIADYQLVYGLVPPASAVLV